MTPREADLPPWRQRNERERKAMFEWVDRHLGPPLLELTQTSHFKDNQSESRGPGNPSFLPTPQAVVKAAAEVPRIRELWRRHYQGRWKRRASDGYSAEEIAAKRWNVSVEAIARYSKANPLVNNQN